MLVLAVDLVAHGLAESIQDPCTTVDGVPIEEEKIFSQYRSLQKGVSGEKNLQVIIDLIFHLVVLAVRLELILGAVREVALVRLADDVAVDVALLLLLPRE